MGIKFVTNVVDGKNTIESCFIESTKDVGGLIVYQNKDGDDNAKEENNKVAFAFEIDWENRKITPCYADYYHMYTIKDNENIKM